MTDTPKTKGIDLDIFNDEVSIVVPEEIESEETGYKCLILGRVCDHCTRVPSEDPVLPDITTCTAASNPTSIFDLQRCPDGRWYKGRPPAPEQDLTMIEEDNGQK